MGVYTIYGIPFDYEDKILDMQWLVDLMVPDLVEEYGHDDVWGHFDSRPHRGGYYLLNFEGDTKLFVACWFETRQVMRDQGESRILNIPTEDKKEKFLNWCRGNNIDTPNAGFYTIIGD